MTPEIRRAVTTVVLEGTKDLPTEEELSSIVSKSMKNAKVDELIRTVFSEEDVIRVGRITLPDVSQTLQYEEGMKKLVASYDNMSGIEDLVAQAMQKVHNSPEKFAEYFRMYMGV